MPRPKNEPRLSYGRTWIPTYSNFDIDYFSPLRNELFKLTEQLQQAELYGEHEKMTYENALIQMRNFINTNKLVIPPENEFFISQIQKINGELRNKKRRSKKYKKIYSKKYKKIYSRKI